MKNCKFCHSENLVKNGKPKGLQRYYCKDCEREQINGDHRHNHGNEIKKAAIVLYLEGNGIRRISRCLSKIFKSKISLGPSNIPCQMGASNPPCQIPF